MDIAPSSSLNINLSCQSNPHFPTMPLTTTMSNPAIASSTKETIYFAYGSNLWRDQMRKRCPTSKYLGLARLKGYNWIIYERGYANIVESNEGKNQEHAYKNEVWGLVYSLQKEDERRLDGNEGVPVAYGKEWIECEFWAREEQDGREKIDSKHGKPDLTKDAREVKMLVYINRKLTTVGEIKEEYIYRMNQGIKDAVEQGMPEGYVEEVLREYIPKKEEGEEVEALARKQAEEFEDGR